MKKDYPHQINELQLSKVMPNRGLLWEMGTGKTKGIIDILRDKYNSKRKLVNTLIFCPSVVLYNWKEEILCWSKIDEDNIHIIEGSASQRIKKLKLALDRGGIVIINYEAVQTSSVYDLLIEFKAEIVVADESHLLKNHKSKRAKKVVKIGDLAHYRFILTGTPILNCVSDIFHQYRFLDKGETFGKSFWIFQDKYMINLNKNKSWLNFPDWKPRPEMFNELNNKIYTKCSRVTKKQALPDLPPLIISKRYVELGKDQKKAYEEMKRDFISFVKSKKGESKAVVAQLALTKALRLLQILSGFVVTDEGETIRFEDVPRLKDCEDFLLRHTREHKIIVWCAFKEDYKSIGKICKNLKLGHVFITGEMGAKEKFDNAKTFCSEENIRVLIGNRKAAGIGINLVAADYSYVYSRNFSRGDDRQSKSRNHRGGSQIHEKIICAEACTIGTLDEVTLESLENKEKLSNRIIDWVYK